MKQGGVQYFKESDTAIRYIVLLGTPIFVLHGMFVWAGYVPSSNYVNDPITFTILGLWLALAFYHFFVPVKSTFDILIRFIAYMGFSVATLMFITGFMQPFAASVVLLFLAAHVYFGVKGVAASIAVIIVAALADSALRFSIYPGILAQNLIGLTAILVLGVSIVLVIISQETRRNALQKSQKQERLQYDRIVTIINNLTDATFSTDAKGKIVLYNAACLNLLDTNDSLKGKNMSELFNLTDTNDDSVQLYDLMREAHTATRRSDIKHTYNDGETIRLELTFAPIKSAFGGSNSKHSTENGYIVIARDVTKEKSLEEERDEFISVVSHELRTPITIVEGTLSNLEVLMERPKLPAASLLKSTITSAHDQTLYLAKMVNDLSTLSRAERGVADEGEVIDVETLLTSLHQEYQKDAKAKKLHLNIDLGSKLGSVHASRLYLEELLQNFITNAIKYTKEGTITITGKRTKDAVLFSVKDTGIGISRGDQQKIFNKFYRSEDYRIRETSGTGLGLYVSAKLSRKLGTTIELKSRLNHGSTFSFTLPVYTEHHVHNDTQKD